MINMQYDLEELKEEARKELARRHYIDYVEYVHRGYWKPYRLHRFICSKLEDVFSGKSKRVIFQMPPRHGKSNTVTETFPSYYMSKYAAMGIKKNVIQISYSADLAEDFGAKNRDKVEEYAPLLFGVEISPNQRTKGNWALKNGATMISAGVGGSVTGKGADLLIIDDPIKNRQEAESETYRERLWDEWTSTLRTRLHKDAAVIVIQTRWHEDDLAGRLIAQGGWEVISMPAICEDEDDLLGRKIGEPLCPELGFGLEWAAQTKRDVGSRAWESLYQQRPTAAEGNVFKRQWFQYYNPLEFNIDTLQTLTISIDAWFKDEQDNDFVAIGVWGNQGADHYLLYLVRERMDFVKTIQAIVSVTKRYPRATLKLIEDKANGPAIISTLRRKIHGIVGVDPGRDSKLSRAMAVTPLFKAGNIYIPDPLYAPWVEEYIEEMVSFPNGKYDDQVDMTTQYLKRYINPSQSIRIDTSMSFGGDDEDDWLFY